MFGHKALIASYERRIVELKEAHERELSLLRQHLDDMQRLVFPPQNTSFVPPVQIEADAVLSVKETVVELTEEEMQRRENEMSERSRLLSGQY